MKINHFVLILNKSYTLVLLNSGTLFPNDFVFMIHFCFNCAQAAMEKCYTKRGKHSKGHMLCLHNRKTKVKGH